MNLAENVQRMQGRYQDGVWRNDWAGIQHLMPLCDDAQLERATQTGQAQMWPNATCYNIVRTPNIQKHKSAAQNATFLDGKEDEES